MKEISFDKTKIPAAMEIIEKAASLMAENDPSFQGSEANYQLQTGVWLI